MKRIMGLAVAFWLLVMFASPAMSIDAKQLAAKRKAQGEVRAKLVVHEWPVYVYQITAGKKRGVETDVFTFTDLTVTSKNLVTKGYNTSNYGVSFLDDGTPKWETMQKSTNGEVAFLAGELRGTEMSGGMTIRYPAGDQIDFGFSTTMPKVIPTVNEGPSAAAGVSAAPTPASQVAAAAQATGTEQTVKTTVTTGTTKTVTSTKAR